MRLAHSFNQVARISTSLHKSSISSVRKLRDCSLDVFRNQAFIPGVPARLPATATSFDVPALAKWFSISKDDSLPQLRQEYWEPHHQALLPIEITTSVDGGKILFDRHFLPLRFFLESLGQGDNASKVRLYLAQCQISELPRPLQDDVPTPDLVLHAGKGDVYDANVWIGKVPTYTPLHRDPNPNFFVQLAGAKKVRLYPPDVGASIFQLVQQKLRQPSQSGIFRGEEMMQGEERKALEDIVWKQNEIENEGYQSFCQEITIERGEALFIPKGWWHSLKGIGQGMNGSANWWFR